jgi:hypothetical protein
MDAGIDIAKNALTLREAMYICGQYAHLSGKRMMAASKEVEVICAAVSPADDINKWIFLQRFIEISDPVTALEFYKVPYYDVILITKLPDSTLSYTAIRPPDTPVVL